MPQTNRRRRGRRSKPQPVASTVGAAADVLL